MSIFTVEHLDGKDTNAWDALVSSSPNGTIFQELKFLSYHGDKFKENVAHVIVKRGQRIIAVGSFLINGNTARTPYGGSYGGLVFDESPTYSHSADIVKALIQFLETEYTAQNIIISPTPKFCGTKSFDTFLFAMLEAGFTITSRDICSVVDLRRINDVDAIISKNARNMIRKAKNSHVTIAPACSLDQFWDLLSETYKKHGVPPTHTYEELQQIKFLYPDKIEFHAAHYEGYAIAAACEFRTSPTVKSSFYFGQREDKRHLQGLSLVIEHSLARAIEQGIDYYDFGTSTVNMTARANIFRFKESFGAQGYFRERYERIK